MYYNPKKIAKLHFDVNLGLGENIIIFDAANFHILYNAKLREDVDQDDVKGILFEKTAPVVRVEYENHFQESCRQGADYATDRRTWHLKKKKKRKYYEAVEK